MGREIAGLPNAEERFSSLEKNRDYFTVFENPRVRSDRRLEEFFVFVNPSGGDRQMTVEPPHWRVIGWRNVDASLEIPDADPSRQEPFFCVTSKGVGYLKPSVQGGSIDDFETWMEEDEAGEHDFGYKMFGLSSAEDYLTGDVARKSELLLSHGLRTEAYWGVGKLERVYYQGESRTIDELKQMGVVVDHPDYDPYEAVRLLKSDDRVEQVYQNETERKNIFERAFETYNKENEKRGIESEKLQIGNPKHERKFLLDFYRRMAENYAVLINMGYIHFRLHSSNVTMAAEIADTGTLGHWSLDDDEIFTKDYDGVRRGHIKDLRDIAYSMKYLRLAAGVAGLHRPDREECCAAFVQALGERLDDQAVREQGTDPESVVRWASKITDAVWQKNIRLPSLQYYEIEDWPI